MTYRSNYNPFDKTDYKNFAFKKSEILEMLKVLDSDFSFEQAEPIVQKSINVSHDSNNQSSEYDYRFFLFKKPLLSLHEATSIMTGYSPQYVNQCRNDTNFNHNFANYLGALDYIGSCASAQILNYSEQYDEMNADDFRKFLTNENIFIDGFNNISLAQQSTNFGQPSLQQTEPSIENLNNEIARLRNLVAEKEERIKELESSHQKDDVDLMSLIFDETATDRYAPDLAYSIKLWLDIYVYHPKADSHNSKANTWIKKNTPYNGEQDDTATRRVREIATPFNDLHISRKKLLEDK